MNYGSPLDPHNPDPAVWSQLSNVERWELIKAGHVQPLQDHLAAQRADPEAIRAFSRVEARHYSHRERIEEAQACYDD